MVIGYARVSTTDQNLDMQRDALKPYCDKIFEEMASGSMIKRPVLERVFEVLRQGDTLMVWRLDRLGRSLKHLIEIINDLESKGISLISLTEDIDTSSPTGKLIFHVFGALAEFERNLIRERTKAGLSAARARGRIGGRPEKMSPANVKSLNELLDNGTHTINELLKLFGISRGTLYKYKKKDKK